MPRQPHTVKRTELKYHVYQDLKEKLIHCTYPPGSMLNEVQLASQYGLSRTPIREAIKGDSQKGDLCNGCIVE